jgi:hypothetical protein
VTQFPAHAKNFPQTQSTYAHDVNNLLCKLSFYFYSVLSNSRLKTSGYKYNNNWSYGATQETGRNRLGVMFGALLYMAQRPGYQENWSGSIRRALKCGAEGEWRR